MPRVILAPRARRWLHAELAYLADVHPSAARRLRERVVTARRLFYPSTRVSVGQSRQPEADAWL